jgi:hypothetical protein
MEIPFAFDPVSYQSLSSRLRKVVRSATYIRLQPPRLSIV